MHNKYLAICTEYSNGQLHVFVGQKTLLGSSLLLKDYLLEIYHEKQLKPVFDAVKQESCLSCK